MRREIQPIVSRNRYRRDGTSAYQLLAEQQRPAAAKAGKERLQVRLRVWEVGAGCCSHSGSGMLHAQAGKFGRKLQTCSSCCMTA